MRRLSCVIQVMRLPRDIRAYLLAWSLALCLVGLLPVRSLLAQGAVIRPDPAVLEIGEGQIETVNIVLENAQDVYAIDVQASFDPSAVEVVDANADQDGVQMIPGDFVKPDFAVRNTVDNAAGTLQYVITQVNPTEPATGAGIVLSIQFRGKMLGAQSTLKIDSVQVADRRGVKLVVQPQESTLIVVPPKPETPTPLTTRPEEEASDTTPAPALIAAPTAAVTPSPAPVASPTPIAGVLAAASVPPGDESLLWMIFIAALGGTILLLLFTFLVLRRRHASSPVPGNGRNE